MTHYAGPRRDVYKVNCRVLAPGQKSITPNIATTCGNASRSECLRSLESAVATKNLLAHNRFGSAPDSAPEVAVVISGILAVQIFNLVTARSLLASAPAVW
jgi:hypothetical protein